MIAEIAIPEVIAAIARRRRQAQFSQRSFERLRDDFLFIAQAEYVIVPNTSTLVALTTDLVVRHPLGTLDALHLAAAIDTARRSRTIPLLVTADRILLAAAAAEGFPTDDPNDHSS